MAERGELKGHLASVQQRCAAIASGGADAGQHAVLLAETRLLAGWLDHARQDLSTLGTGDIVSRHIPAAIDELEAVVSHTETATSKILQECEALEEAAVSMPCHQAVTMATTRIYEACSFQDITGQRLAKVVQLLQLVESYVAQVFRLVGPIPAGTVPTGPAPLLNGPQQSHEAMDQDAVDALLASLE